ncbi:MAG: prepilin-type N-terminal cleavage/methylation domain-containing protein [bacterium]|nr:prepilin-type N-terminal cleavage/methylation domain-containing protein [bacterium]
MKINRKGFTLIELLVVVAVIGILSSIILIGLRSAQMGARDSKRMTDVRGLQNGLEIFFTACGKYPAALNGLTNPGSDANCSGGASIGINQIPKDPANDTLNYSYCSNGTNSYVLGTKLEISTNQAIRTQMAANFNFGAVCSLNPALTCAGGSNTSVYCATN